MRCGLANYHRKNQFMMLNTILTISRKDLEKRGEYHTRGGC
jgi:hypothetical protein